MVEGREGDWECGSCLNLNYAFRSFCNRCKQPRLLVDVKTPKNSKWLPRVGDWICSGCSNNNYASRDKCKKCAQPKEEVAMPAVPLPGTLPIYAHYFARMQELKMNYAMSNHFGIHQSLTDNPRWSAKLADSYELQSNFSSSWSSNKGSDSGLLSLGNMYQSPVAPKGWREGDWMCNCGFHNYSSRGHCKKCNAPSSSKGILSSVGAEDLFPTLGMKRLASEEFVNDYENKRLNAGYMTHEMLDFEQFDDARDDFSLSLYSRYGKSGATASVRTSLRGPEVTTYSGIVGKGAKEWRDGDWMCNNCNNHNYASRSHCNRCKTQKEAASLPVSVS